MKSMIVGAAIAVFAAVALATAPVAPAGPEEDLLNVISDRGITWPSDDTRAVIDAGYGVCTDWDHGAHFDVEVADLLSATDWTPEQAGFFIRAATGAFCPDYEYKIG